MTQEATEKQRKFLARISGTERIQTALNEAAAQFGYDHWYEAPMSKKVVSCCIDIFLGKADAGLYVWAVRRELEAAA